MDIKVIQDKIKNVKSLSLYEPEELKYLDKSVVGKTLYKQSRVSNTPTRDTSSDEDSEPEEEIIPYWRQKVTCEICGKTHSKSAVSKHRKSRFHIMHEKINAKLREFILE